LNKTQKTTATTDPSPAAPTKKDANNLPPASTSQDPNKKRYYTLTPNSKERANLPNTASKRKATLAINNNTTRKQKTSDPTTYTELPKNHQKKYNRNAVHGRKAQIKGRPTYPSKVKDINNLLHKNRPISSTSLSPQNHANPHKSTS
jgi:hypothetical protein